MGKMHINIRKNARSMFLRENCRTVLNGPWLRAIQGMCDEITKLENKCIEYKARLKARRRWNDQAYRRNQVILGELRSVRAENTSLRESNALLLKQRARVIFAMMEP